MSEFTICNYCSLRVIKESAKKQRKMVVLKPAKLGDWKQGTDVYVVGRWEKPSKRKVGGNWVAWMAEIPDHCVC